MTRRLLHGGYRIMKQKRGAPGNWHGQIEKNVKRKEMHVRTRSMSEIHLKAISPVMASDPKTIS